MRMFMGNVDFNYETYGATMWSNSSSIQAMDGHEIVPKPLVMTGDLGLKETSI